MGLPDEPESREGDASEDDRLHGHDHAVDGGSVREDGLDVAEVDRESDRASAFSGAFLAELNQFPTA